ncbi:hypothetical protein F7Q93_10650 [Brucella pituitosa]|uniref:Uncharacterized protein n=1 Tax=Brucella pituitosa TaxID=571256 RepID=A0A643EZE9_9HYPH|nr:hypothetical protein F7Q93_10650 [Brucella pituitosa]
MSDLFSNENQFSALFRLPERSLCAQQGARRSNSNIRLCKSRFSYRVYYGSFQSLRVYVVIENFPSRAVPVDIKSLEPLYLFVFTLFRTQSRFLFLAQIL